MRSHNKLIQRKIPAGYRPPVSPQHPQSPSLPDPSWQEAPKPLVLFFSSPQVPALVAFSVQGHQDCSLVSPQPDDCILGWWTSTNAQSVVI